MRMNKPGWYNIQPHPRTFAERYPSGGGTAAPNYWPYFNHRTLDMVDACLQWCPRCHGSSRKWKVMVCKRCGNSGMI